MNATVTMSAAKEKLAGLCCWQHVAVFLFACLVLISRRPDAIFHAQFYAEDGHVWFADEYNFGWWSGIWRIYEGYHHVFMRLGAALGLLAPLAVAPLVLNLAGIAVQALPANLLLSVRSSAWGGLRFRAFLVAIYLALPNTREMLDNISQAQWPLTLCAFLVLMAEPPSGVAGCLFDCVVLLLCGLTGPQCIFLLPIALFVAWRRRSRWLLAAAGVLAVTCVVQGWPLLRGGFSQRPHYALGASPALLVRIVAGHVFVATLLGTNGLAAHAGPRIFIFMCFVAACGIAMVAFCLAKSPLPMKLFVLLAAMLLAVSLISPTTYPPAGVSVWELLARAGGVRYWYLPTMACAWLLVSAVHNGGQAIKAVSIMLLCAMCFGIVLDWRIPPLKDLHFTEDVQRFEMAPAGTIVTFPENPEGWNMQLVKHASH